MRIEITEAIAAPADAVFAYLADFENNPRWQGGMVSCRWTSEGRGVGATYAQEARFLGRPVVTTFEVTALEPGRSIRIESIESTFPIQVTRAVEPAEGGCVVSAVVEGGPGGLASLLAPLMRLMVRRSVAGDYARLEEILESGER